MDISRKKVIGIAGGMGPLAGMKLFNNIINLTVANTDQQHIPVVLMSFPGDITDRTAFLEGIEKINPALAIAEVIGKLETAGATVAGIACNTAHAPAILGLLEEQLKKMKSEITLINMPFETCRCIKEISPFIKRVAVLSTNGTCKSGVYLNWLREFGYEMVVPDPDFQNDVIHRMIYDPVFGLKANSTAISRRVRLLVQQTLRYFKDRNTDAIIVGCTELSLVFKEGYTDGMLVIDSSMSLARALIREAGVSKLVPRFTEIYGNETSV